MPKFARDFSEEKMNQWIKEGRGTGEGEFYKGWFTRQDGPPGTDVFEIPSWKLKRKNVVLFGSLEPLYFYSVEWLLKMPGTRIVDIRDQYPLLPLSETLEIAARCGYEHPKHPITQYPIVLTSDFRITLLGHGRTYDIIRTVKPTPELLKKNRRGEFRTLQKFEIERLFWLERGISDWKVVTEKNISSIFAKNSENLRAYYAVSELLPNLTGRDLEDIATVLTNLVQLGHLSLRHAAQECDHRLGFINHNLGTSLMIAYHLITIGAWEIDMYTLLDPSQPLQILKIALDRIN